MMPDPIRRAVAIAALATSVSIAVAPASAADEEPGADTGEATLERLLRPAHAAFGAAATRLDDAATALCPATGAADGTGSTARADRLAALRERHADAVASFSAIEPLRLGPMLDDNRFNRLFYWPDPRRAGERQLRALLAGDAAAVTAASMPGRSVAVQGLPALERLLHGDGAAALREPDAPDGTRCAAVRAIAGNVANIARALDDAWREPGGVARELVDPRAGDVTFRSAEEVVRALLTQLDGGLASILERKLRPPLERAPPALGAAPFARSASTWANLGANVETLRALALDSGLAARAGLERELGFEFRVAATHLERLLELRAPSPSTSPLPDTLGDEEAGLLRALDSALSSIADTVRERLGPALGVRTGFNADDGD